MSETKQKILGINTRFSNFEYDGLICDDFGSRTSFMYYDAVIIDSSYLAEFTMKMGNLLLMDGGCFQKMHLLKLGEIFKLQENKLLNY